jgi:hypothetical protein
MNEVRVPEEWQKRKKIKIIAISITIAVLFILLSI